MLKEDRLQIIETWNSLEYPSAHKVRRIFRNAGSAVSTHFINGVCSEIGKSSRPARATPLGLLDELVPVLTGHPADRLVDLMREVYRAVP